MDRQSKCLVSGSHTAGGASVPDYSRLHPLRVLQQILGRGAQCSGGPKSAIRSSRSAIRNALTSHEDPDGVWAKHRPTMCLHLAGRPMKIERGLSSREAGWLKIPIFFVVCRLASTAGCKCSGKKSPCTTIDQLFVVYLPVGTQ